VGVRAAAQENIGVHREALVQVGLKAIVGILLRGGTEKW